MTLKNNKIFVGILVLLVITVLVICGKALFNRVNLAHQPFKIPILTYHHIQNADLSRESKLDFDLEVSPQIFDRQMAYIKNKGYSPILSSQMVDFIYSNKVLPPNPILITVDDGYKDNVQNALPILLKYNFKANFEIPVKALGMPGYMTWDDLKILRDSGMGIDSHSLNHCTLAFDNPNRITRFFKPTLDIENSGVGDTAGCATFGQKTRLNLGQVTTELRDSKKILEENLGITVETFAYPFGNYNQQVLDIARKEGYKLGYTTLDQDSRYQVDLGKPLELPRYHVFGQQEGHLDGFFSTE
jgi:peptidoglycan/xylan/chitin deacetylase (PgdA/CDA1 family)